MNSSSIGKKLDYYGIHKGGTNSRRKATYASIQLAIEYWLQVGTVPAMKYIGTDYGIWVAYGAVNGATHSLDNIDPLVDIKIYIIV